MATDVVGRGGGCRRDENLRKRTKAVCVWDPQSRDPAQVTGLQAKRARQVTSLIGSMSWREFLAESAVRRSGTSESSERGGAELKLLHGSCATPSPDPIQSREPRAVVWNNIL